MASLQRHNTVFPRTQVNPVGLLSPNLQVYNKTHESSFKETTRDLTHTSQEGNKDFATGQATYNQFAVPTTSALNHSLCLVRKPIWRFYQGIEYSANQGDDQGGVTVLLRRLQERRDQPDPSLFIMKKQRRSLNGKVTHIAKPIHENIVSLYNVFSHDGTLSFVYEEMDISLEQIFLLDIDPWSVNSDHKEAQIASICRQILQALSYFNRTLQIPYGQLSLSNVLLNRSGVVKLANAGMSIMFPRSGLVQDQKSLAKLLATLYFPLALRPTVEDLQGASRDFADQLVHGDKTSLMKHAYFDKADPGELVKLVVRTMRLSFNPPSPFEL